MLKIIANQKCFRLHISDFFNFYVLDSYVSIAWFSTHRFIGIKTMLWSLYNAPATASVIWEITFPKVVMTWL